MLLLHNLAQPEWISVGCDEVLQTHVGCEQFQLSMTADNTTDAHLDEVCHRSQILSPQICISLCWKTSDVLQGQNQIIQCKQLAKVKSITFENISIHISYLKMIFLATNLLKFIVLFAKQPDTQRHLSVVLERDWVSVGSMETNQSEGFLPCVSPKYTYSAKRDLFFDCPSGEKISSAFVGDGQNDCNSTKNDENFYRDLSSEREMCTQLFYYSIGGKCKSFTQGVFQSTPVDMPEKWFVCSSELRLDESFVNDLVPDCGEKAEDETLYLSFLLHHTHQPCRNPNDIPCVLGHPTCFSFSKICIYRLNIFHHLVPCRTGSHLQSCRNFFCNGCFKCPQFYCIPWGYVCNGVWDCPWAHDETLQKCINRNCQGMFKCKESLKCLHLEDICDNYIDCPREDDELMCDLNHRSCLKSCHCLNYAIVCLGKEFELQTAHLQRLPHTAVHLNMCNLTSVEMHHDTHTINISHNCISEVTDVKYKATSLVIVDMSFNVIEKLMKNAFINMPLVKFIVLKHNKISLIERLAFKNATNIFLIDFSSNDLSTFPQCTFVQIEKLQIFNIRKNPLVAVDEHMFKHSHISFNVISTDNQSICCIKPEETLCSLQYKSEHSYCSLLPSQFIQIGVGLLCCLIFTLNLATLCAGFIYKYKSKRKHSKNKKDAFLLTGVVIVLGEVTLALYLTILWGADAHYDVSFAIQKHQWKTTSLCTTASTLHLIHNVVPPFFVVLFSVARLWVVMKPFDCKIKSVKFVAKIIMLITAISVIFSVICMRVVLMFHHFQNVLCLLTADSLSVSLGILVFHFMLSLVVVFLHLLLVIHLKRSKKASGQSTDVGKTTYVQLTFLTTCNFVSWIPPSALYVTAILMPRFPSHIVVWMTVVGEPSSSVATILLYLKIMRSK